MMWCVWRNLQANKLIQLLHRQKPFNGLRDNPEQFEPPEEEMMDAIGPQEAGEV